MEFKFRLLDAQVPAYGDQPYIRKLRELKLRPDYDYEIAVLHDDWCKGLQGSYCNCDPDVQVVSGKRRDPVRP
jgi:hypothetical protein